MIKQRKIELLAPAKNLECGIEAINHGADAVYIGAPKFGARAAAVNSLEDIEALVKHAHLYNARISLSTPTDPVSCRATWTFYVPICRGQYP